MTIKTKLLLSACLAVAIGTMTSNLLAYRHFGYILRTKVIEEQQQQLETIGRQLARIIEDQKTVGIALTVEPRIQDYLRKAEVEGSEPRVLQVKSVLNHLNYLLSLQKNIDQATLIDRKGTEIWTLYPVDLFHRDSVLRPADFQWPEDTVPELVGPYGVRQRGEETPFAGFYLPVHDVENPTVRLGSMILHVRLDIFTRILEMETRLFEHVDVYFKNTLIWSSANTEGQVTTQKEQTYRLVSTISDGGIRLEAYIPETDLKLSLRPVAITFAGLTFLSILIYLIFLLPFLWRILLPLNTLYSAVLRASEGNFEDGPSVKSGDEFQVLSDQFNHMLREIRDHINAEIKAERRARRNEYDLLLSQINPHFLYNTLNSVKFLSSLGKKEALEDVVDSLIDIMQHTVGKPENLLVSTIGKELELVKKYLLIQKHQYGSLFSIEYNIDTLALGDPVPGFIIQPLVENAIFHGIRPTNRPGKIELSILKVEQNITITVSDNGVGSDLSKLPHPETRRSGMKSIGLDNIKSRLAFHFPETHVFLIDTAPGKGFTVSISYII